MGTLFDQPIREPHFADENMEGHITWLKKKAKKHGITYAEAVATFDTLERQRTNNLQKADNDIKDEQLAGFGSLLNEIADSLSELAEAVRLHGA